MLPWFYWELEGLRLSALPTTCVSVPCLPEPWPRVHSWVARVGWLGGGFMDGWMDGWMGNEWVDAGKAAWRDAWAHGWVGDFPQAAWAHCQPCS